MPFERRAISPYTFLMIGDNYIQLAHIVNIFVNEKVGMESITFILTSSPSVSLHGEDAKKYITSLQAFMNVYGCIGLVEYAENLIDEEIVEADEERRGNKARRTGWKGH